MGQDEVLYNLSHPLVSVRGPAYMCILRHLRHSPLAWQAVIPTYIAAIESGDQGGVDTALGHLAEMTVLCQEKSRSILVAVFQLGLYSNNNTASHINDVVAAQHADGKLRRL